jgi:16S rRNA (guanine(1405)-N(7))-methyltransferase
MPESDALWIKKIVRNKKYRQLDVLEETIEDLIRQVQQEGVPAKQVEKAVREKLHHIVAPYLETVDYETASQNLKSIAQDDQPALEEFARNMLLSHTSTAERMDVLAAFYGYIVSQLPQKTGLVLEDFACAANPFALPWMQLPLSTQFLAYDLNGARVNLLNQFFMKGGYNAQAFHQDILVDIPRQTADAAFLFKEAHRFEQRQKGATHNFLEHLCAPLIFLSLPARNMTGRHDLREKHHRLVADAIAGTGWQMDLKEFGQEILFCIRK